jgi:cell shape-determining protein MreD
MGFLGDLLTIEPMGRLTLSYGLVALGTTSVRHFLFRRHMITSFVLTLVAALLLRSAWAVHRLIAEEEFLAHTGEVLAAGAGESLHTAVWAVLIHQGLLRLPLARSSRSLALESPP